MSWQPWPDSPVDPHHQIRSFHSVTLCEESDLNTIQFLTDTMGFRKVASDGNRTRFETGAGGPSSVLDVLDAPEAPVGEEAAGTVHHVAWRATNDAHELDWREVLVKSGATDTRDRAQIFPIDLFPRAGRRPVRDRHGPARLHHR
jgi:glyoxalase family protein